MTQSKYILERFKKSKYFLTLVFNGQKNIDVQIPKFLPMLILCLSHTLKVDMHLIYMCKKYAVLLNTDKSFFDSLFK